MGLTLELARLMRTSVPWLEEEEESFVSGFVLHTVELEFQPDPSIRPCLDKIELDGSNVLWRLSSEGPSWESIQYFCKLAYLSQSFYRCVSTDQWVWTVVKPQHSDFEIRSNVVPRQAYCMRLQGTNAFCAPDCRGGFVPGTSARSMVPCESCALGKRLIDGNHTSVPSRGGFWELAGVASVPDHDSLGQGSQGEVKKVLWRKGVFARKRVGLASKPHGESEVLTREVDVALSVTHPNLVHCFGCSRLEADHYYCDLFMELLDGDLERLLEDGGRTGESVLSFRDVLDVLLQIAEAMRHLHEQNFVHGDLKPANIFVSKLPMPHNKAEQFYLVKVGDFGSSQRIGSVFDFRIGTTKYLAPEVLECRMSEVRRSYRNTEGAPPPPPPPPPEHPQKIDVYSFGVVAYQVITGEPEVYVGKKNIAREVIAGRLRPDFNLEDGSLDGDRSSLLPLIQSCWSPNPQDRPPFSQICAELNGRLVEYDQKLRSEQNAKRMHLQRIDPLGDCTSLPQRV